MGRKARKKRLARWTADRLKALTDEEFFEAFAVAFEDRSELKFGHFTVENRIKKGAPPEATELLLREAERRKLPLETITKRIVDKAVAGQSFISHMLAPSPWKRYEIHASEMFISVLAEDGINIDERIFDARLTDLVTRNERQVDLLLVQHHPKKHAVAFEFRDFKKGPISVSAVEAFITKIHDTGVNKGVIVSPSGYHNPAREKARHYGVALWRFREVSREELARLYPDDEKILEHTTQTIWLLEDLQTGYYWVATGDLTEKPRQKQFVNRSGGAPLPERG